ncbi:hypothetical protein [Motiliproteus sp. MSK22-1]|uniref:hypothetical protein n=1 Tax=Motiliproteus sp. MSK22-1 TaxID=1897630 RepID=UPI000977B0E0|nr:hypothetical protein [Motiliproteus sp. MSK22-1]OMH25574.1 hypothetical protein BGP75_23770 [Motiliproteus sp. MSK22-1]
MKKLFMLLASISLFLGTAHAHALWTQDQTVEWVRAYSATDEVSFVKLSSSAVWEGCENTRNTRIYKLKGVGNRAFSILLSAAVSKQPIRVDVIGHEACEDKFALISEVQAGSGG